MISHVNFLITNRCNSKCRYCYLKAGEQNERNILDSSLIFSFLDKFRNCGGKSILFTGGEVLLHPEIDEVVKYANQLELDVSLFTNGLILNEDRFMGLKEHVKYFSTSLDGPVEIHDHNRGIKGAYEETVRVLKMFKEHGIKYSLQMTIGKFNLNNIDFVAEMAHKYQASNVSLVKIIDQGKGKECTDQLEDKELFKIKDKAKELSKKYKYRPYFMTHLYLEKEIKTYFTTDILTPIYWIDSEGDICLYSVENKKAFKLTNITEYPEGIDEKVWRNSDRLAREFTARIRDKKIISFDEELEKSVLLL